jgi:hypothetical protein
MKISVQRRRLKPFVLHTMSVPSILNGRVVQRTSEILIRDFIIKKKPGFRSYLKYDDFNFISHSFFHRLRVYPLGEDIPRSPAFAIFLLLARVLPPHQVLLAPPALPVLQLLPSPVLAQALPVLLVLQALLALPFPVLISATPVIDCSQLM